jgi:hypothetical protein
MDTVILPSSAVTRGPLHAIGFEIMKNGLADSHHGLSQESLASINQQVQAAYDSTTGHST